MGTIDLKSNIHKIVDGIQSEQLLQTLYDFLKVRESDKPGRFWGTLTEEQKQEVLLAYDESEDENNLIAREKAFGRTE
jgi:hypothetical protein